MAVGALHDVRNCFTVASPYLATNRYIVTVYVLGSERFTYIKYAEHYISVRKLLCSQNTKVTHRWCYVPKRVYVHADNKICFTPAAEVNFALRYCTYSLGSSNIIYTFPVSLAITYNSDRKCFVEQNIVSNRYILVKYQTASDRNSYVCIREEVRTITPKISLTLLYSNERSMIFVIGDSTQRNMTLSYTLQNERKVTAAVYREIKIATPKVSLSITDINTSRYCMVGRVLSHTDRTCWFMTSPMTERQIMLHYTSATERQLTFYLGRVNRIFTFVATPSQLVPSERFIFVVGFAYKSERYCYSEMRPLWYKKTPLASSPLVNVRSNQDKDASVKITNDRPLEMHGFYGDIEEITSLNKHRLTNTTDRNTLEVSAVDNTGAMINSLENKDKQLVYSQVVEIRILHTMDGGNGNNNSAVIFDGDTAINSSSNSLDGGNA